MKVIVVTVTEFAVPDCFVPTEDLPPVEELAVITVVNRIQEGFPSAVVLSAAASPATDADDEVEVTLTTAGPESESAPWN